MRDFGADSDEDGDGMAAEGKGAPSSMIVQFATMEGEIKGPQIDVPLGSTVPQMEELMNQLLENENKVTGSNVDSQDRFSSCFGVVPNPTDEWHPVCVASPVYVGINCVHVVRSCHVKESGPSVYSCQQTLANTRSIVYTEALYGVCQPGRYDHRLRFRR